MSFNTHIFGGGGNEHPPPPVYADKMYCTRIYLACFASIGYLYVNFLSLYLDLLWQKRPKLDEGIDNCNEHTSAFCSVQTDAASYVES